VVLGSGSFVDCFFSDILLDLDLVAA
jgi:hypothetical protein